MKTPMQILSEKIENGDFLHTKAIGEFIKYNLLEKERNHAKYFAFKFRHEDFTLKDIEKEYDAVFDYKDQEYYEETFNTEERNESQGSSPQINLLMKTPMQELIDEAIKYSRKLSTEGYFNESLAADHIIDLAESLLEKEKEVMCEFAFRFNHDAFTENYIKAEFEETFNTKEK